MTSQTINIIDDYLYRTAEILRKYGSFVLQAGLQNGKMGIAIFLYRYARYSNNSLYANYAGELLDEIVKNVHGDLPLNIESGLCGIGFGIEYLIKNKYVEAEAEEILEEFDSHIRNLFLKKEINDLEVIHSIALYWIQRGKEVEVNTSIDKYYYLLSIMISEQTDNPQLYSSIYETVRSLLLLYYRNGRYDREKINSLLEWMSAPNDAKNKFHNIGCDMYLEHYLNGWFLGKKTDYYGAVLRESITLNDLFQLSWFKLLFHIEIREDISNNKISQVVSETTLLEEFTQLANIKTMGLNSYMTVMAWVLLDCMEGRIVI